MNLKKFITKLNDFFYLFQIQFFAFILALLLLILLILRLSNFFYFFSGDVETARYLLSALIQAQASILAIVISLTLIAVQITTETYSTKIFGIFIGKKNIVFHCLLILYIFSIIYEVILLGNITGDNIKNNIKDLSPFLSIELAIGFMLLSLIYLPFYIGFTLNLLQSENIIKRLIGDVSKQKVATFAIKGRSEKDDPLLLVRDTLKKLIDKGDETAVLEGIVGLRQLSIDVFSQKDIQKIVSEGHEEYLEKQRLVQYTLDEYKRDNYSAISNYFLNLLTDIGNKLAQKKSEKLLVAIVVSIKKIGVIATEYELEDVGIYTVRLLKEIGKSSIKEEISSKEHFSLENIVETYQGAIFKYGYSFGIVIDSLNEIAEKTTNKLPEVSIGQAAYDDKIEHNYWRSGGDIIHEVITAFGVLGKLAIESEWEGETEMIIKLIYGIGDIVIHKGKGIITIYAQDYSQNPVFPIVYHLKVILTASHTTLCSEKAEEGIGLLEKLGTSLAEEGISPITIVNSIGDIYKFHEDEKYYGIAYNAVTALTNIGKITIFNGNLEDSTEGILSLLKEIVIKTVSKKDISYGRWKDIVEDIPKYLLMFGAISVKNRDTALQRKLIEYITEINNVYKKGRLDGFIDKIITENESSKTFSITEFFTSPPGLIERRELPMNEEDLQAFKKFKKALQKSI